MTELGSRLRTEREEQNMTLSELAEKTRIQKRYLQAIEEGDYSTIPGKFYVRAFIKQYAEAVGLHVDEIFEEYKKDIPAAHEENVTEQLSMVKARNEGVTKYSKLLEFLPKVIIALVVIALLIGIYFIVIKYANPGSKKGNETENPRIHFTESDETPKKPKTDKVKKDDKDKEDKKEDESAKKATQKLSVEKVEGTTTTYSLINTDEFLLEVKASKDGESWIEVLDDSNQSLFANTLVDGASETFDFKEESEAIIVIGRATEAEVFVNGEKLEYELDPTESDNYIYQRINIKIEK